MAGRLAASGRWTWDQVLELTPAQIEFHYEHLERFDADQRLRFVTDLRAVLSGAFGGHEGASAAKAHLTQLLAVAGYTE